MEYLSHRFVRNSSPENTPSRLGTIHLGLRKRGDNSRREDRPNLYYPFFRNRETGEISVENNGWINFDEIYPRLSDRTDGNWRWGRETAKLRIAELDACLVKKRNEFDINQRDYLHKNESMKRVKPKSFWLGSEFSSDSGTKALKEVLGNVNFNSPKAVD